MPRVLSVPIPTQRFTCGGSTGSSVRQCLEVDGLVGSPQWAFAQKGFGKSNPLGLPACHSALVCPSHPGFEVWLCLTDTKMNHLHLGPAVRGMASWRPPAVSSLLGLPQLLSQGHAVLGVTSSQWLIRVVIQDPFSPSGRLLQKAVCALKLLVVGFQFSAGNWATLAHSAVSHFLSQGWFPTNPFGLPTVTMSVVQRIRTPPPVLPHPVSSSSKGE